MPRHIFRLILVILVCVVVGYGAKRFFTVNSFYEYGHYRGDSVADIASDKPKFKGVGYCASCHAKQIAEWSNGVHNSSDIGKIVKCEVCHGAGGERDVRRPVQSFGYRRGSPEESQNGRPDRHQKALHAVP